MTVQYIPPPSPRELLPPLLACLQSANATKQPSPALLPLLSPILRQRVQLLSTDSWLPLLCWDGQVASRLPQLIGKLHLEPHPVSGEIEVSEPDDILYRRLDPETLHARLVVGEFELLPTYLWCTGEQGTGWKLAELRGIQDGENESEWYGSMTEADQMGASQRHLSAQANGNSQLPSPPHDEEEEEEEEDDDYWASYDRTPGRTPATKRSPAPGINSSVQLPSQSELEYFARYAAEVQPAMDAHDPEEEGAAPIESTLNGNSLNYAPRREPETEPLESTNLGPAGYDSSLPPAYSADRMDIVSNEKEPEVASNDQEERYGALNHPRPSSSASSNSVERLEREAENHSQAEIAIKQHISTDMKSLFRLARSAGIKREEFERIVQRELEVLPLLEMDG